ncbi:MULTISPECIES: hypothetical protein [unclassified Imperialibacter]|uniref:hypothetical protein n=1 Tax=unclassified Imperialibacter TaxID=2629706 RepID=UPI00125B9C39|nr:MULTISPECIES: hypothetical protein [unclassified Imperialibacter]CAD5295488.1 exported hypothetical protein [Imperialibacter sp. 75]CAD5296234.1 exported hypothetical protein [Imperialibacter sp. 89]VVT15014.1 exported hypothetical protein [Imperialibacter sp. EC-SDR9]
MKKIQLAFLLLLFAGAAYAQFEDTKFVIGGAIGYNNDAFSSVSSIGVVPSFAKTIKSDALIGLSGGYYTSIVKNNDSNTKETRENVHAGIYYQKFYGIAERVFFNWRALAGMSFVNQGSTFSTYDTRGYEFNLMPGLSWKVTENIMLQASLGEAGYSYQSQSSDSQSSPVDVKNSQFNIRFNNPQLGVAFLIK